MSTNNSTPTQEQIRATRRASFGSSVNPDHKARLTESHTKQDTRRERNVVEFYTTVLGK